LFACALACLFVCLFVHLLRLACLSVCLFVLKEKKSQENNHNQKAIINAEKEKHHQLYIEILNHFGIKRFCCTYVEV